MCLLHAPCADGRLARTASPSSSRTASASNRVLDLVEIQKETLVLLFPATDQWYGGWMQTNGKRLPFVCEVLTVWLVCRRIYRLIYRPICRLHVLPTTRCPLPEMDDLKWRLSRMDSSIWEFYADWNGASQRLSRWDRPKSVTLSLWRLNLGGANWIAELGLVLRANSSVKFSGSIDSAATLEVVAMIYPGRFFIEDFHRVLIRNSKTSPLVLQEGLDKS